MGKIANHDCPGKSFQATHRTAGVKALRQECMATMTVRTKGRCTSVGHTESYMWRNDK